MKTSEQLTLPFGETVSTFSPADSRASRSASPVREKAREMTAISGRRCLELFGRFVPAGSWAKTFSELLIGRRDWFSSRCVLTWKMRATKSDLTKEITHEGERFVPLLALDKLNCFPISDTDKVLRYYDKLNEWMFDYRNLISAGLAIDVNTLPENPYE